MEFTIVGIYLNDNTTDIFHLDAASVEDARMEIKARQGIDVDDAWSADEAMRISDCFHIVAVFSGRLSGYQEIDDRKYLSHVDGENDQYLAQRIKDLRQAVHEVQGALRNIYSHDPMLAMRERNRARAWLSDCLPEDALIKKLTAN